ncbi:hypothetical protein BDC45DRAFT_435450 [Circinella umbellata]|nr:hypothetical protein BDC45DRAFT_435450 [Circinella umbellata]
MPIRSLNDELDAIANGTFDYGIVPGSATVFIRDKIRNMGRFDLTLLEGVLVVIDVSPSQGFMVTSCSALSSAGLSVSTSRTVHSHMNAPFDNLETLLLSISPVFCQRFQQLFISKCTTNSTKPSTSTTTTSSTPSTPASTANTSSTTNSVCGASVIEGSGGSTITDEDQRQQQKKQHDDDFLIDQLLRKVDKTSNDNKNTIDTTMISNQKNNKNGDSMTTETPMDDINEWIHQP